MIRKYFFLLIVLFFYSCEYSPFQKNNKVLPLDTILDFTTVDSPPTFEVCKDLIDKAIMNTCFRTTFSSIFSEALKIQTQKNQLTVRNAIDEEIILYVSISKEGKLLLKDIKISEVTALEIPEIKTILFDVINQFPKVYPAIKRGVPVATEYTLPIKIKLGS